MTRIYQDKTVLDAALGRIRYFFDEFENIVVGISGGKDSTVVFNLALEVAKEKNRLPLNVMWVDQEMEWQSTVDTVEKIMRNPLVKPYWLQVPVFIDNILNGKEEIVTYWDPDKESLWMREKSDISIKEEIYGTRDWEKIFHNFLDTTFQNKKACYISGMRAEESPVRFMALTEQVSYKYITYGKILNRKKQQYTFYPIYDWSYTDVWKYIHDNEIPYNKIYDLLYQRGEHLKDMRVSNLHHETSIQSLIKMQELEPITWQRITARLEGVNTVKHLKRNSFTCPKELPNAFASWEEYALYLLQEMTRDENERTLFQGIINKYKQHLNNNKVKKAFYKKIIDTILTRDVWLVKFKNFIKTSSFLSYMKYKRGKTDAGILKDTSLFSELELKDLHNKIYERTKG